MKQIKKKVFTFAKPNKCPFNNNPNNIDYKQPSVLKKYVSTRGRIFPASRTGVSAKCQRKLALSIKRARYLGLMPFAQYV
jgi:small subunit ribosomal protein S18